MRRLFSDRTPTERRPIGRQHFIKFPFPGNLITTFMRCQRTCRTIYASDPRRGFLVREIPDEDSVIGVVMDVVLLDASTALALYQDPVDLLLLDLTRQQGPDMTCHLTQSDKLCATISNRASTIDQVRVRRLKRGYGGSCTSQPFTTAHPLPSMVMPRKLLFTSHRVMVSSPAWGFASAVNQNMHSWCRFRCRESGFQSQVQIRGCLILKLAWHVAALPFS